ncbi:MAG: M24 family metallopeptidase, partial [Candidatus Doudnabacteria bacterium]|nr:M24 family metallopeptidase [Candidatus Doudnabacteria bacterium]
MDRIKKLQIFLEHPLLIKKKENLLYLTGRSFMHGYLLVLPLNPKRLALRSSVVFFGDGLEKPPGVHSDILKNVGMYLGRHHVLQLEDQFTFAEYKYLRTKTQESRTKIRHLKSPVDFIRIIKGEGEIALIRKSMDIVGKVFAQVKKQLKNKTWTEIRLAEFIKHTGFKLGAENVSFPPIVASGANAAIPHHIPSSKRLKAGESIIIDFG